MAAEAPGLKLPDGGLEPYARLRLTLSGAVQGVGFRPFIHRLASELGLSGFVINDAHGVVLEAEGPERVLGDLPERILRDKPPHATPRIDELQWLAPTGAGVFEIRPSASGGVSSAILLPDMATCSDCARELSDPSDRRHSYPFINCTNCGPRFSIIRDLPYDRPRTTMSGFRMCAECQREYGDVADRRFHAQPNACPACGPALELRSATGTLLATNSAALEGAVRAVRRGEIVAMKGLGGFHLMVDATNSEAVVRLRQRKARWKKPLAIMAPDLASARELCDVSEREQHWLTRPEAPIVLMQRRASAAVCSEVAPGNPRLGVMLPYTPLHHVFLGALAAPVVATSGNVSEEPICIDNDEALERLGHIADVFLLHDRPIERQVDDSVAMVAFGELSLLRRSRGFAPLPLRSRNKLPCVLSLGAYLKNTIALSVGDRVFVSQHVGDLSNELALAAHERVIADFLEMYDAEPLALAHDLHPDYHTPGWLSRGSGSAAPRLACARSIPVQHHHAHLAACLLENDAVGPSLGVTWDGTGYGSDGTIWGGEFLLGDATGYRRVAHLRPFRLVGADAAVREPRRSALGLLWEIEGRRCGRSPAPPIAAFSARERAVLLTMLERRFNAPVTSSAGRLFDGIASLLGLSQVAGYEAEAAVLLEQVADPLERGAYPMPLRACEDGRLLLDWEPAVRDIVNDQQRGVDVGVIAARFHNTLVQGIWSVVDAVRPPSVALTGGCFQNRRLLESCRQRLQAAGIPVLTHHQLPANDGGISAGQVAVAAAALKAQPSPS